MYIYILCVCVGNHPKITELFRLYTTVVSFRRLKKLKAETDAASQYVSHQSEMIGYWYGLWQAGKWGFDLSPHN